MQLRKFLLSSLLGQTVWAEDDERVANDDAETTVLFGCSMMVLNRQF